MADGDGIAVNRIMTDKKLATDASNYADSIVCDVTAVTGGYFADNYMLVWTNAYSGGFPPEQ